MGALATSRRRLIVAVLAGLIAGVASAFAAVRNGQSLEVTNGPWATNPDIGSVGADPYTRAVVARTGLLALARAEAVYFIAASDDAGEALDGRCRYRVRGTALPTRWWSITAYGMDHFLLRDEQHRYSVNATTVAAADGSFSFDIGGTAEAGAGIYVPPDQRFDLLLRLYNAAPVVLDAPATLDLPSIERLDCDA